MPVRIANEEALAERELAAGQLDRSRRKEIRPGGEEAFGRRLRVRRHDPGAAVEHVVWPRLRRRPAVPGGEVLEELDGKSARRAEARDPEPCPEDVVQVFLLDAGILALPRHLEAEQ